jgi:hypothetical protein
MSATVPPVICAECRTAGLASGRPACQDCAALALIYARPGLTRSRPADPKGAPE